MNFNPFIINGYESDKYFCDREVETEQLIKELTNGNNVALIAPRRMGKSGLIKHCFAQKALTDNFYTFYVDIYATRSLSEFVFRLSKEILSRLKPFGLKALQRFWECIRSLQSGISFSPLGEVSFTLQVGDIVQSENSLTEIFQYLSHADRPCIVAFDEFQQICTYDDKNVEALLRTYVQQCPSARFIFAGSQRHLMTQMFQSASRPFYQSVSMMHLGSIDEGKYEAFAKNLFAESGKTLGEGVVRQVFDIANHTTWYIQKLMNTLYAATEHKGLCSSDMTQSALDYVINTLDFGYREIMFRMPEKQRQLLIAIAKEGVASSLTSGEFVKKYRLSSTSSVQSAAKGLLNKDYISHEQGKYFVYDIFFAIWLRREY